MSELRFNFLNWRPDLEDTEHDGLVVADNVIHEPEGFKPAHLVTTTSFATTGGLASITSLVAQPFGIGSAVDPFGVSSQVLSAWLNNNTLNVGIDGVTASWTTTGFPNSFATAGTSQEVVAFESAVLADFIFTVQIAAQDTATPSPTETISSLGYVQVNL